MAVEDRGSEDRTRVIDDADDLDDATRVSQGAGPATPIRDERKPDEEEEEEATRLSSGPPPAALTGAAADLDATEMRASGPPILDAPADLRDADLDVDAPTAMHAGGAASEVHAPTEHLAGPSAATEARPDDATRASQPAEPTGSSSAPSTGSSSSTGGTREAAPDAATRQGAPASSSSSTGDSKRRTRGATSSAAVPSLDRSSGLTGARLLDRYDIGKKLGSGGFGSVYQATDSLKKSTGEVAEIGVKVMDAKQLQGRLDVLVQEVSRSHHVSHPNILRVYDIHVDSEFAFITMELLEGEPLNERLARAKPRSKGDAGGLPIEEVDRIAEQVCSALDHCHTQDLVHADIKPENVFLCQDGTVKLLDLGIAQVKGTRGVIAGYSAKYASPQQMAGEESDPRDDLYSVGVMLYICLTGLHPFDGKSAKVAKKEGMQLSTAALPRRYRKAVERALQWERDERVDSARSLWRSVSPAVRRRNAIFAALGVATVAGLVGASLLGQQIGEEKIAVSAADQEAAAALYEEGVAALASDPGSARGAFLGAVQKNPYLEDAAEALAGIAAEADYMDAANYSLIWADIGGALVAAPTSEALQELAHDRADWLLGLDASSLPRSRVLSELRAPLCVLSGGDYRAPELVALRDRLNVRC